MTDEEIADGVRAIVAQSFNVSKAEINDQTTAEDLDGWDSLAHATLIMRIEKSFNADIDSQAASEAQDVGALICLTTAAVRSAS